MSDSDDLDFSLPPNLRFVPRAEPEPMSDRGARLPAPPKPDRSLPPIDPEADELQTLLIQAITIRGAQKKDLVPHWLACDIMKILDPHRQAPRLVRQAAMVLLRDLARQTMRAYMPPPDALKLIEEAEAAEVRRWAAEDAAAAVARRVPAACAFCGKPVEKEGRSLIVGETPRWRVCEPCFVATVVAERDRRRRQAAFEEAQARAAEADGVSRRQQRQWKRELTSLCPRPRGPRPSRPKGEVFQPAYPPGWKGDR